MKLLRGLRDRFTFTRGEITVILFLSITYGAGLCVRWFQGAGADAGLTFAYQQQDSTFRALSRDADAIARGPTVSSTARAAPETLVAGSINLNTATAEELDRLPGIGPHYALEIVRYRERHGPFRSVEELLEVKGIGPKKLARIRPYVRLR